MKTRKLIYLGMLSLACLGGCAVSFENSETKTDAPVTKNANPLIGTEAADFELQSMDGKTVKLSDYKGKKIYLKFWASWCGPCRQSMPELMELAAEKDRDFEILSMVSPGFNGEKSEADFPKWYQEQGYKDIPVLYDHNVETFTKYGVRSIPTVVFIDSQGKIANVNIGPISNQYAKKIIAEMK